MPARQMTGAPRGRARAQGLLTAAAAVLLALGVILPAGPAHAGGLLQSSPGALASSHQKLEGSDHCNDCHDGGRDVSNAKCLGCHAHSDLKRRIASRKGFHSSHLVAGKKCQLCHQEHRGRSFDLMGWRAVGGQKSFNHGLTGWPLRGKHAVTRCSTCHKHHDQQGLETFLGADHTCGGCHAGQQPHGKLRTSLMDCERCHAQTAWKPPRPTLQFNHNDKHDAAMPLVGTHADVSCGKCHPGSRFVLDRPKPAACGGCHKSPHDGQLFGQKPCEWCHSPTLRSLRAVRFNHKRRTGYPLVAKHAQIKCASCHQRRLGKRKPNRECVTCHESDNKHRSRFSAFGNPPRCVTCHSQAAWKKDLVFDHRARTHFPLTGKHTRLACRRCHRGNSPDRFERFDMAKNGCMGCHQHRNAHGGKFKKNQCLTCHVEGGNRHMKTESLELYHGENSRFPLRNAHAKVKCQLCHEHDVYKGTPRECGTRCHEDSLHRGALGKECSRCHEPGQWKAVRFDHAQDTRWPLRGKHTQSSVTCAQCHKDRQYQKAPTGCAGCHGKDDIHKGKLGQACERCHNEQGQLLFQHNRDARFRIDGAHTLLACARCHASVQFKPVASTCFGCHPEPAVHKGRYGTRCEQCHSTASFGDIRAQHDVGDFRLTGAHDRVACTRCHPNGEKRRGSGNLCITCHRQDDIHQNSLSPRCGQCHTQRAFSPARFDHTQVGCNLMGLHRTLPCADCHQNGNYGAVSPLCVSCHRNDARGVTRPNHDTLLMCGDCHNPDGWRPVIKLGREGICR